MTPFTCTDWRDSREKYPLRKAIAITRNGNTKSIYNRLDFKNSFIPVFPRNHSIYFFSPFNLKLLAYSL